MTLVEAFEQGIQRVRQPRWLNKTTYLKLDFISSDLGDSLSPWGHLYDPTQKALGYPKPQDFPIIGELSNNVYEEYVGPLDNADRI